MISEGKDPTAIHASPRIGAKSRFDKRVRKMFEGEGPSSAQTIHV
jgi:hypothetical protein